MRSFIILTIALISVGCVSEGVLHSKHPNISKAGKPLHSIGLFGLSYEKTRVKGQISSTSSFSAKDVSQSTSTQGVDVEYIKEDKIYKDIAGLLENKGFSSTVVMEKEQKIDFKFNHSYDYKPSYVWIGRYIAFFSIFGLPIVPFLKDKGIITYKSKLRVYKDKKFIKEYDGTSKVRWKDNYLIHPTGSNIASTTGSVLDQIDPNNPYQINKNYSLGLYWASHDAISQLSKDKKTYSLLVK